MGSEIVKISEDGTILNVDGVEYDLTLDLHMLIVQKHPRPNQWTSGDYQAYKYLSIQTKVRSHSNLRGVARPRSTWKYKHKHRKMIVPGESIKEESEDSEDSVAHHLSNRDYLPNQPVNHHHLPILDLMGKLERRRIEAFYKGWKGEGVVYPPGDINGLTEKLQLLDAEFFAGNTTVRNELVHVLLRLKQLTCKEYTNITAGLAASL